MKERMATGSLTFPACSKLLIAFTPVTGHIWESSLCCIIAVFRHGDHLLFSISDIHQDFFREIQKKMQRVHRTAVASPRSGKMYSTMKRVFFLREVSYLAN